MLKRIAIALELFANMENKLWVSFVCVAAPYTCLVVCVLGVQEDVLLILSEVI